MDREAERSAALELSQAAATFGLSPQPRSRWRSGRSFGGEVQGFDLTWTLTPKRIGREIQIRLRHPKLKRSELLTISLEGLPDDAALTSGDGFVELSFADPMNDVARELVPVTRGLLTLVGPLRED